MPPPAIQIECLYDYHADALFGFLLNLTREESEARDLLQEVFVKVARRPECLEGIDNVRPYMLRMAHRMFIDSRRSQISREKRQNSWVLEHEPLFITAEEEGVDLAERTAEIDAAMAELPAAQRAVVHLKIWEGLTFAAISQALEIPQNTAVSRYRYALEKLRQKLGRSLLVL